MLRVNDKPLNLVDEFTYIGSNISSAESNAAICIGQAWYDIDKLITE